MIIILCLCHIAALPYLSGFPETQWLPLGKSNTIVIQGRRDIHHQNILANESQQTDSIIHVLRPRIRIAWFNLRQQKSKKNRLKNIWYPLQLKALQTAMAFAKFCMSSRLWFQFKCVLTSFSVCRFNWKNNSLCFFFFHFATG